MTDSQVARAPFWSDDFDMDLLKVLPETPELLTEKIASVELVTQGSPDRRPGSPTYGRLIHPACWNSDRGLAAWFGFRDPARPAGYVTSDPELRCTYLEALRDAWCHSYVLIVEGQAMWDAGVRWGELFEPLMYHRRNWHPLPDARVHQLLVRLGAAVNLAMARMDMLLMARA